MVKYKESVQWKSTTYLLECRSLGSGNGLVIFLLVRLIRQTYSNLLKLVLAYVEKQAMKNVFEMLDIAYNMLLFLGCLI